MKKATVVSIIVTTVFYILCGSMGYAAFGDHAPGNLLTGFGFYNPYWLLDIANFAIVVHLIGAYQVLYLTTLEHLLSYYKCSTDISD
jgi:amino acid permease